MAGGKAADLEARLAALEAQVAELRRELASRHETRAPGPPVPDAPESGSPPADAAQPPAPGEPGSGRGEIRAPQPPATGTAGSGPVAPPQSGARFLDDGSWLGKLGIALLLFGVVLLFRYSLEQGWLAPPVRLAGGLVLAAVLLGVARSLPASRRGLGRVLNGGGIATLYITLYAGFQRYELLPETVAFGGMVATTALSFALAVRDDEAVHSLIGVAGGFATPFLLWRTEGDVAGLVVYAALVLAGAAAVFTRQGWRVVLAAGVAGMWLVLGIATGPGEDRAAVQAGIALAGAVAWWLPLARRARAARRPGLVRADSLGLALRVPILLRWPHPNGLIVAAALASFGLTGVLWDLDRRPGGLLAFGLAGLWAAGGLLARRHPALEATTRAHAIVALVLAVVGTALLLEGNALRVFLAGEAWALHAVARGREEGGPRLLGHALFAGLALWWLGDLLSGIPRRPLLDPSAMSELVVVLAVAAAAPALPNGERKTYLVAAHVGVLGWLLRELGDGPNGQALVSGAWIAYAAALLWAGLRLGRRGPRRAALATFPVVAAKLVLVDLEAVDVLWRIGLFLGFGALLLALSYRFPDVWREPRPPAPEGAGREP